MPLLLAAIARTAAVPRAGTVLLPDQVAAFQAVAVHRAIAAHLHGLHLGRLAIGTCAHPRSNLIADLDAARTAASSAQLESELFTLARTHPELIDLAVIRGSQALLYLDHFALDRGFVSSGHDG